MTTDDLRAASIEAGYGDPTALPHNRILMTTAAARRTLLVEHLVERLSLTADDEEDEEDALSDEILDAWLESSADEWPADAPSPPTSAAQALDRDGPWSAAACGVEIRMCSGASMLKGRGAYAVREFAKGALVGLYWGEPLTQRQWAVRHGWKSGEAPARLTADELQSQAERRQRLDELVAEEAAMMGGHGAPMGGADNGGAYVFSLLLAATEPEQLPAGLGARVIYMDAEDGSRSSWCRYINHAHYDTQACNLEPRTNPRLGLAWFEARRAIGVGEELCFSYGKAFNELYGKGSHESERAVDWHASGGKASPSVT